MAEDLASLQKNEFQIRNRPILILSDFQFGNSSTTADGKEYPHSIQFNIKNVTKIPAVNVNGTTELYRDGEKFPGINLNFGIIVGDVASDIVLNKGQYKNITVNKVPFHFIIHLKYSGMLGELLDEYKTDVRVTYRANQSRFEYHFTKLK